MSGNDRPPDDESGPPPEKGRVLRPEAVVLGNAALVPDANLVSPAPNSFTHELAVDEPFWLDRSDRSQEPDGVLAAGTPVVVLVAGDERCRVVAGTGLYVEVGCASLRPLAGR
jgi:hypothetical protein